jgi:hypothetical protein
MKTEDLLKLAGIGIAAYLVWQLIGQGKKALTTATAPLASSIANLWTSLTVGPPQGGVLGDVILPNGQDIGPLSSMQVRTDTAGNVYVNIGGDVYQLGQSDINGNWPAQLVVPTDFGLANSGSW